MRSGRSSNRSSLRSSIRSVQHQVVQSHSKVIPIAAIDELEEQNRVESIESSQNPCEKGSM